MVKCFVQWDFTSRETGQYQINFLYTIHEELEECQTLLLLCVCYILAVTLHLVGRSSQVGVILGFSQIKSDVKSVVFRAEIKAKIILPSSVLVLIAEMVKSLSEGRTTTK